jgi:hypothetical protein
VIDELNCRIVGSALTTHMRSELPLEALELVLTIVSGYSCERSAILILTGAPTICSPPGGA